MTQMSKTLERKTVPELAELRVTLLKRIAANPDHSGLDRVELEDVEGWIALRTREAERQKLEPTF
ncbi:MAG: hypothetical protein ACLPTQ_20255 [Terriglobales bacterium]